QPDVDISERQIIRVVEEEDAVVDDPVEEELAAIEIERALRVRAVRPDPESAVPEPVLELRADDPARVERQVRETEVVHDDDIAVDAEDVLEEELIDVKETGVSVVVQIAEPDAAAVERPGTPVVLC